MTLRALPALWFCLLVALASCAGSEGALHRYDSDDDISRYTSRRVVLGRSDMSAGLASGQRVLWRAEASCPGASCAPSEVDLVFFNDSSSDLNLDYRRLEIVSDGVSGNWADLASEDVVTFAVPKGEFLRVRIPADYFVRIAEAQDVAFFFGLTASTEFAAPFARRQILRELMAAARLTGE